MPDQSLSETSVRPPRLAVDGNGFVWRVYPEHWSMAPSNPDNSPVPEPVTYYEPCQPEYRLVVCLDGRPVNVWPTTSWTGILRDAQTFQRMQRDGKLRSDVTARVERRAHGPAVWEHA